MEIKQITLEQLMTQGIHEGNLKTFWEWEHGSSDRAPA
jgi:hypothetical protein